MTAPSEYVLEAFREGADFTLYRGRQRGGPTAVLAVVLASEQSPQSLRRLEHEYSHRDRDVGSYLGLLQRIRIRLLAAVWPSILTSSCIFALPAPGKFLSFPIWTAGMESAPHGNPT
jgi:hypothetical protein